MNWIQLINYALQRFVSEYFVYKFIIDPIMIILFILLSIIFYVTNKLYDMCIIFKVKNTKNIFYNRKKYWYFILLLILILYDLTISNL